LSGKRFSCRPDKSPRRAGHQRDVLSQPAASGAVPGGSNFAVVGSYLLRPRPLVRYDASVVREADKLTGLDAGAMVRGRYRLLHSTSAGGGTVRAFDLLRQQDVALRLYGPTTDPAVRQRIRAGASRVINIVNPAVAPLFSFDEQGDWALAVRAWVEGDPLAVVLARRGPLARPTVSPFASALLDAVEAFERAGLRHGAITARNVILTGDATGEAVVVDGGITVAAIETATLETELQRVGTLLALGLGLGERFDARAARLHLEHGGALVEVLERLIAGRPARFAGVEDARAALDDAIDAWLAGRAVVAPWPSRPGPSAEVPEPVQPVPAVEAPTAPHPEPTAAVDPSSASTAPREVRITGVPRGARVRWDGRDAGVTPLLVVDRVGGEHQVELEAEGYAPQRLTVEAGGHVTVQYVLAPASSPSVRPAGDHGEAEPASVDLVLPAAAPELRPRWRRWQPWAVFGVGGVVLLMGVLTGATPLQLAGLLATLGAVGAMVTG
jgi:hypothetical protein